MAPEFAGVGSGQFCMPSLVWWRESRGISNLDVAESIFINVSTKLPDAERPREGLLVDEGSLGSLMGDRWLHRVTKIANAHGRETEMKPLTEAFKVAGVGKGHQECAFEAKVPIALSCAAEAEYSGPVLKDSDVPGLMGLNTMEKMKMWHDCAGKRLIIPGPGEITMVLPPGSVVLPLEKAPSGHHLLPCTEWHRLQQHAERTRLPAGNHFYGDMPPEPQP